LLLVEPAVKSNTGDVSIEIKEYITASLLFFRKNRGVSLVVLSGIVTGAALNFIYEFWQLYLEKLDIPVAYFGLFSAGFMLLGLPGNLLAHAYEKPVELQDNAVGSDRRFCCRVLIFIDSSWLY
jgi:hypothetical protein